MKVKTLHELLLTGVGILLVMVLLVMLYDSQQPQISWVIVRAQVLDVEVIPQHQVVEHKTALSGVMVQYVYQFDWNQQAYINRNLVPDQATQLSQLTTIEARLMVLRELLQPGTMVDVWINPENPQQSVIKHPRQASASVVFSNILLLLLLVLSLSLWML